MEVVERFTEPEQDRVLQKDKALLPARFAKAPWVYLHSPQGWEVVHLGKDAENVDEWEWLPLLQRIEGKDGVGGVMFDTRTRKFNFAGAIASHQQAGNGTAIQPDDRRLGKWVNYNSRFYPCEQGKKCYVEPGEQFTKLTNGQVMIRPNREEHVLFLRHLVESGLVEPMQAEVFEQKVATVEGRIPSLRRLQNRQASVYEAEALLRRMRAAWGRLSAKAVPVPVEAEVELDTPAAEPEPAPAPAAAPGSPALPQPKRKGGS